MSQQAPPTYMVDHKRGEVNELKGLLSNPKIQKDQERKREVIKKVRHCSRQSEQLQPAVCLPPCWHSPCCCCWLSRSLQVIAYMTLGIDVSKLFSEMVMVSA